MNNPQRVAFMYGFAHLCTIRQIMPKNINAQTALKTSFFILLVFVVSPFCLFVGLDLSDFHRTGVFYSVAKKNTQKLRDLLVLSNEAGNGFNESVLAYTRRVPSGWCHTVSAPCCLCGRQNKRTNYIGHAFLLFGKSLNLPKLYITNSLAIEVWERVCHTANALRFESDTVIKGNGVRGQVYELHNLTAHY